MAYRRFVGDFVLKAVGLCGTYNLKFHLLVFFHIQKFNFTANADLVKVNLVLHNYFCILKKLLKSLDPGLQILQLILILLKTCIR